MPTAPRADEAGGLYHAPNRGNLRADIFRKDADFAAFERILYEGLQIHQVELYSDQFMGNHWHLVVWPQEDDELSRFVGWLTPSRSPVSLPSLRVMSEGGAIWRTG